MYKTTRALVLREVRYREADKILTVLTDGDGKLTVTARGALRKGCKYGAAAQALTCSEMTLFGNRGKWRLNEAVIIEQFLPLRADLESLSLGTYFAEVLEAVSDEDSPDPALLQLGLNSLFALSSGLYPRSRVKAAFELRVLCLAGFAPAVDGEGEFFSLDGGVLHGPGGVPGGGKCLPLGTAAREAMRYVAAAPAKRIFAFSLSQEAERQFCAVCEGYLLAQLERGFRSLEYWKNLRLT